MLRSDLLVWLIASISVVDSNNCSPNDNVIPVCSDNSTTSNIVYLSGVGVADNETQCSCSLSTVTPTNITITTNQIPLGCQYKFQFLYMNGSRNYSCIPRSMISINTDGGIEINLLSGTENGGGFEVCLEVKSEPDESLNLSCGKSRWSTPTSSKPTDIETSTTGNITTSEDESKQPTTITSEQQTTSPSKNDNSMSAIIGGSVGGLFVIIVIIIIVTCVICKRRKDKNYESPEVLETDAHPYQNILDNRSGEITHQPKQNNALVHQEKDPDTGNDNVIIKPSNGNQEMEYLENDLYISSDYVTGEVVVDNSSKAQLPVVAEYAQVNKSNANKTTNGKCKTGPKGDNYTVANKGGKMVNNDNCNEQFKIGPSGDQYAVVTK